MTGALARAFRQYKGNTRPRDHRSTGLQSIVFDILWAGNDFQGENMEDTAAAAERIFDRTKVLTRGDIKIPQQKVNGLVVRVEYQYPLPWYVKSRMRNATFMSKLAMNDIARCLNLAGPNRDTDLLLTENPDPSPWWQRWLRSRALRSEKKEIESSKRAAAARARDFH